MGELAIVFGRIQVKTKEEFENNRVVISNLYSDEKFSDIRQPMFHFCESEIPFYYRSFLITFGATYKNIEHSWNDWLFNFEDVIKQLSWNSIRVVLETEMFGVHQYFWLKKTPGFSESDFGTKNNMIESDDWFFGGGYRDFWGNEQQDWAREIPPFKKDRIE